MGALLGLDTIMLDMTLHTGYAHQVDRPHQPARKVVQDGVQRTWTALAINPTGVIHNQAMSAVIEPGTRSLHAVPPRSYFARKLFPLREGP